MLKLASFPQAPLGPGTTTHSSSESSLVSAKGSSIRTHPPIPSGQLGQYSTSWNMNPQRVLVEVLQGARSFLTTSWQGSRLFATMECAVHLGQMFLSSRSQHMMAGLRQARGSIWKVAVVVMVVVVSERVVVLIDKRD